MQLDTAVDRFLASPRLAESTRRSYGFDLRDFTAWLDRRGTGLDAIDVRVYHGVHFRAADVQAAQIGRDVAEWMATRHFRPLP